MFNGVVTATFEHVCECHEIAVNVGVGIRQRMAHSRLSREVDDSLGSNASEQFGRALPVRQVQLSEMESRPLKKLRQSILLQDWIVVVVQVVHAEDFVTFVQKALRQMETNKARRTCYEYAHKIGVLVVN